MTNQHTDYVADVDALVFLLEANGFKVVWGEFTRLDGCNTRVACQPVDPRKLAEATVRACKWQDADRGARQRLGLPQHTTLTGGVVR